MSVYVGQQIVEGRRVPFWFPPPLSPPFHHGEFQPGVPWICQELLPSRFYPQEFLFHAVAIFEGLIDTVVKTSETGRLVKALEDVSVDYDGTVRNSLDDLIQLVYVWRG